MTQVPFEQVVALRFVLNAVSDGSATIDIASATVESYRRWEISHVNVRDDTTEYTKLLLVVGGKGEEYVVAQQDEPEEGDWYWFTDDIILYPGERLIARFEGTTNLDGLVLAFSGKEYRQGGVR